MAGSKMGKCVAQVRSKGSAKGSDKGTSKGKATPMGKLVSAGQTHSLPRPSASNPNSVIYS